MRCYLRTLALSLLLAAVSLLAARAGAHEPTLLHAIDLFERQDYDEARRVLGELPEETRKTGQALYYVGRLDLIDGDPQRAVTSLEEAIDLDPAQSEYHHWLAVALMRRSAYRSFLGRMRDAMKAVKELQTSVELDTLNLRPRMTLFQMMARSYDRGGSKKEDLFQQAKSIAEIDSVMGYVARGTLFLVVEKDMVKAGAELRRSLDLAPANRAAAVSYSDYLWECDRKDEAIQVLTSYVERMPDDKPARFNLGTRMILSGTDFGGAKVIFEECLALQSDTGMPSETMVRWCLGLACHLLGEEDVAQKEWSTVYEMDKDFDHILERSPQMSELNSLIGE